MSIQPVGPYHPVRRMYGVPAPTAPAPAPSPRFAGAKDFMKDVWVGGKEQVQDYGHVVLHPVDSAKRGWALLKNPAELWRTVSEPYKQAIREGNPGEAVGRALANVAVVGAAVLGGRALLRRGGMGGGPSVGYSSGMDNFFRGVGNFFGSIGDRVSGLVRGVGDAAGSAVRWLLPQGGGPSVGWR